MSNANKFALINRMIENATKIRYIPRKTFTHHLFGKHEQQNPLGGGYTEWSSDGVLHFKYTVPPCVCVGPRQSMPLGAIVSLIDETTTWVSIGEDRSRRGGVSITLEAALAEQDRPPVAGDTLIFKAKMEKTGKSVGFQSCEIIDEGTGRLVATGYHVKLLTTEGRLWALAFGPTLLPLTEQLSRLTFVDRPAPVIDPDDADALRRLLEPTSCEVDAAAGTALSQFTCVKEHLQETSLVFGGVQAMLHEVAAQRAADAVLQKDETAQCCSMLVRYLAGSKKGDELSANAKADASVFDGNGIAVKSTLAGKGVTRSESELSFVRV